MVKKIVAEWSLGTKFKEIKVFTYNYNEESITTYGKQPNDGKIEIYKIVSHIQSGDKTIYKQIEVD